MQYNFKFSKETNIYFIFLTVAAAVRYRFEVIAYIRTLVCDWIND